MGAVESRESRAESRDLPAVDAVKAQTVRSFAARVNSAIDCLRTAVGATYPPGRRILVNTKRGKAVAVVRSHNYELPTSGLEVELAIADAGRLFDDVRIRPSEVSSAKAVVGVRWDEVVGPVKE